MKVETAIPIDKRWQFTAEEAAELEDRGFYVTNNAAVLAKTREPVTDDIGAVVDTKETVDERKTCIAYKPFDPSDPTDYTGFDQGVIVEIPDDAVGKPDAFMHLASLIEQETIK